MNGRKKAAIAFDGEHHPTNAHKVLDSPSQIRVWIIIDRHLSMFAGLKQYKKRKRYLKVFNKPLAHMIKFRPNIEEKHKNSVLLVDGIFF
jgi:hypothetical protein